VVQSSSAITPDVQDLAGIRAGREHRVIPALARIANSRALLLIAVDLADEAVDVNDQPALTRSSARRPRARQRHVEHTVKLADMTERERPQKRAQRRRGRNPSTQQPARATRSQQIAVIDAVRTQHHREDQRHHLAPRVRCPRPLPGQQHEPVDQPLDPQPLSKRRDERDPRV
jgi:hypothetical protein